MPVHLATPDDLATFTSLWSAMLLELDKLPANDIPYSTEAMNGYVELFRAYTTGLLDGVVLLWSPAGSDPAGVLMVGATGAGPPRLPPRWGKSAWIWGVYVTPEARCLGAWRAMMRDGERRLRAMGFRRVEGQVVAGNAAAYRMDRLMGGAPYAILMEKDLGGGAP